jgi:hypothetical protein
MQAAQSRGRKRFVEDAHAPADGRLTLDQIDGVSGLGQLERGLDACDAAAHHQDVGIHRRAQRLQRLMERHPPHRGQNQGLGFLRGHARVVVNPRAVLANVRDLDQIAVRPALAAALRKVSSCMSGEQAATTTRFRPSCAMSLRMRSWPGSEHMNL